MNENRIGNMWLLGRTLAGRQTTWVNAWLSQSLLGGIFILLIPMDLPMVLNDLLNELGDILSITGQWCGSFYL